MNRSTSDLKDLFDVFYQALLYLMYFHYLQSRREIFLSLSSLLPHWMRSGAALPACMYRDAALKKIHSKVWLSSTRVCVRHTCTGREMHRLPSSEFISCFLIDLMCVTELKIRITLLKYGRIHKFTWKWLFRN